MCKSSFDLPCRRSFSNQRWQKHDWSVHNRDSAHCRPFIPLLATFHSYQPSGQFPGQALQCIMTEAGTDSDLATKTVLFLKPVEYLWASISSPLSCKKTARSLSSLRHGSLRRLWEVAHGGIAETPCCRHHASNSSCR